MKFKEGDTVRIIDRLNYHHFNIGEEVTILNVNHDDEDYEASNQQGDIWYLTEDEIEAVK